MIDDKDIEVVEPIEGQTSLEDIAQEPTEDTQESPQPQETPKEDSKTQNLRILRERAEKAEREADEMRRYLAQQQMEVEKWKQSQQQRPEPEDINLNPNDLPEWQQVTKYIDKKTKSQQEELQRTKQQLYEMSVEAKLKAQFPDFDTIVTKENIESLRLKSSAIAQSIDATQDLYTKAAAAYDAIKSLGIAQANQVTSEYAPDKTRVQKNLAKPRPAASVAQSPLNNANMFADGPLTQDRKKAIYAEMEKILQGRE